MNDELGVPRKIKDSILSSDGELAPGFSGIGIFRGRRDYTEDERTLLQHFFTNVDSMFIVQQTECPVNCGL